MNESKNAFEGDVLLVSTEDGGDFVLEQGLIKDCRDFSTAAYLSLFGGNSEDLNGRKKDTWWGNIIKGTKENEYIKSETGALIEGLALTSGNLRRIREGALRDLSWIKKDAGADEIAVHVFAEDRGRIKITAEVKKDSRTLADLAFEGQWREVAK